MVPASVLRGKKPLGAIRHTDSGAIARQVQWMTGDTQGWLAISTDGFAAMNAARPPEHLVKELVQNALDSFAEQQHGTVTLRYGHNGRCFEVSCCDDGSGIADLGDLRVVYLTHKTDSHLKRGRFGRGFKEVLCIAEAAVVESGGEGSGYWQYPRPLPTI